MRHCCQPSRSPGEPRAALDAPTPGPTDTDGLIILPGGTFRMGTDAADGFPDDREGPVREVTVEPFAIDAFAVTNARFAEFVDATGYRTEAEVFGWTYVFAKFVPAALRRGAPRRNRPHGGWVSGARTGAHRRARAAMSRRVRTTRSCTCPGTTPSPTASGPGAACPPKPSGSTPLAAGSTRRATRGVMSSRPVVNTGATSGRAAFPCTTPKKTATSAPRPSMRSSPTVMACTTCPATSGSGAPTGSPHPPLDARRVVPVPRVLLQPLPRRRPQRQHPRQLQRQHGIPHRRRRLTQPPDLDRRVGGLRSRKGCSSATTSPNWHFLER